MIDKVTAIENVLTRMTKMPLGSAIDLRTYKRNRSVLIRRVGEDDYEVEQNGYEQNSFAVDGSKMKKLLKTLLKKEFPRSTKIRLYNLDAAEAMEHKQRKTL